MTLLERITDLVHSRHAALSTAEHTSGYVRKSHLRQARFLGREARRLVSAGMGARIPEEDLRRAVLAGSQPFTMKTQA